MDFLKTFEFIDMNTYMVEKGQWIHQDKIRRIVYFAVFVIIINYPLIIITPLCLNGLFVYDIENPVKLISTTQTYQE